MTTKQEIIEKVQKMKVLADRGVGGEKDNAARMVEKMMEEHDITEEDLKDDLVERHWVRYDSKDKYAKKLLAQIIYEVTADDTFWVRGRKAVAGIDCTAAQAVEIAAKYEFFYNVYLEDLEIFYSAFISKNRIFPETAGEEGGDDGEVDYERIKKVRNMMESMDKHDYHKQLEV